MSHACAQYTCIRLHDALPISTLTPKTPHRAVQGLFRPRPFQIPPQARREGAIGGVNSPGSLARVVLAAEDLEVREDRKSTRLNSSHVAISYAVFCLKKKNKSH